MESILKELHDLKSKEATGAKNILNLIEMQVQETIVQPMKQFRDDYGAMKKSYYYAGQHFTIKEVKLDKALTECGRKQDRLSALKVELERNEKKYAEELKAKNEEIQKTLDEITDTENAVGAASFPAFVSDTQLENRPDLNTLFDELPRPEQMLLGKSKHVQLV